MKKISLIATAMLLSLSVFAQHENGTFSIQPKVGLNIASYINGGDSDPRVALAFGVEGEYQFSRLFSLAAGVVYSMQGDKEEDRHSTYTAKVTDKFDYLNVPIVGNLYVVKGLALKLGIQPAFNLSAKYELKAQGRTITQDYSDIGVKAKAFELSLPVGLSYEYKNFVIDGRYNLGLTKIVEVDNTRNSVFQITLGYKVNL